MSELPPGWRLLPFGEVIDDGPSNGHSPRSTGKVAGPLGLKLTATTSGRFRLDDAAVKRLDEPVPDDSRAWLEPGDLLIQRANTLEYLGASAIFEGPPRTYVYPDLMMRVRIKDPLLRQYAWRYLNSSDARAYFRGRATGTAGNMPKITGAVVRELPFPLPPAALLGRIVAKLDALLAQSRAAREQLDAVPQLVEQYRQSVLAAAFRGDLTKEWREKNPDVEPASKLLERIRAERRRQWEAAELAKMKAKGKAPKDDKWKAKYEEPEPVRLKGLPRGWCAATLESLCDADRGIPYGIIKTGDPVPGGVPTVRCGDVKGYAIDFSALKRVSRKLHAEYSRTELRGGEVLLAIRGSVGAVAVAGPQLVGANIAREIAMIPLLKGVEPRFAMYMLSSPIAQNALFREVRGVAQQGINLADVRQLHMVLPPLAEQRAIVSALDIAMNAVLLTKESAMKAGADSECLERSLLAKAFRGELDLDGTDGDVVRLQEAAHHVADKAAQGRVRTSA